MRWFLSKHHPIAVLLIPFTLIYWLIGSLYRCLRIGKKYNNIFIIAIGNVSAGGGGKTPTALYVSRILENINIKNIAILTRGYKGKCTGPEFVNAEATGAAFYYGDEPTLLAKSNTVIVSKSKREGIDFASRNGIKVLIMDDGYQNYSVIKHLHILVAHSQFAIGNGFLLPSGPLRESLDSAVSKADAIISIDGINNSLAQKAKHLSKPMYLAGYKVQNIKDIDFDASYLAFSGLAYNDKFFHSLRNHGIKLSQTLSYADHAIYSHEEIEKILYIAKKNNLSIITTEKDWVKLPKNFQSEICIWQITLKFNDNDFEDFLTTFYQNFINSF